MNESEFLEIVDLAFANIGYQIKKEVSFPFVRIDRFVTNTCYSYFIEAEADKSSFANGIQQLSTIKNRGPTSNVRLDEYARKGGLVLAIPECPSNMMQRAEMEGIRVLESQGLQKLLDTRVEKPTIESIHHYDLARAKNDIQNLFWNFHTSSSQSEIILEIADPKADPVSNWYPLLRITAKERTFSQISFFSGIKDTDTREGKRNKETPEWVSLQKRIPSDYVLQELHIARMLHTLGWENVSPMFDSIYPVFEKLYYMAFGSMEIYNLELRMFESINPFVLAYGH